MSWLAITPMVAWMAYCYWTSRKRTNPTPPQPEDFYHA